MTTSDSSLDDTDNIESTENTENTDYRLPRQREARQADAVVIKFSNDGLVLELEGDDVDLGTDLKVRNEHQLIAEFRRDAVDGWWFKSSVLAEPKQLQADD